VSLRLRLILLNLLTAGVVFAAAGTLAFQTTRAALVDDAQADSTDAARVAADSLGREFRRFATTPHALADVNGALYETPWAYLNALNNAIPAMLASTDLYGLYIFFEPSVIPKRPYAAVWYLRDEMGQVVPRIPNMPGERGYDPAQPIYDYFNQEWYQQALRANDMAWSEPFFDEGGANITMVSGTLAVRDGDRLLGVIGTDVPLSTVEALAMQQAPTPNSYVILVSAQGQLIAHQRQPELVLRETLAASAERLGSSDLALVSAELAARHSGFVSLRDPFTGAETWAAYAPVPETGWSLLIMTPTADLLGPLEEASRRLALIALLALAALATVLWLAATTIVRPVRALLAAAERVAAGDRAPLSVAIARRDELGRLARTFEGMAAAVAQRDARLREEVDAQTAALRDSLEQREDQARVLQAALLAVRQKEQIIAGLSTPVVPILRDTLVVPVVGALDEDRAVLLVETVLQAVERRRARTIIVDVTGLPVLDTAVARALVDLAHAAKLLGARTLLVGIRPEVAQTLVSLGVDLAGLQSLADLEAAVELVLAARA
jgi:anti-anti-sigma factor